MPCVPYELPTDDPYYKSKSNSGRSGVSQRNDGYNNDDVDLARISDGQRMEERDSP